VGQEKRRDEETDLCRAVDGKNNPVCHCRHPVDSGGTSTNVLLGYGTVFRISPSGNYTNLHSTSGAWSNIPGVSVTNSIGALLTVTNFGGALQPQGFYRFDITP
jgi:hypothetical protein